MSMLKAHIPPHKEFIYCKEGERNLATVKPRGQSLQAGIITRNQRKDTGQITQYTTHTHTHII